MFALRNSRTLAALLLSASFLFVGPAIADKEQVQQGTVLKRTYDFKLAGKEIEYALFVPTSYKGKKTPSSSCSTASGAIRSKSSTTRASRQKPRSVGTSSSPRSATTAAAGTVVKARARTSTSVVRPRTRRPTSVR